MPTNDETYIARYLRALDRIRAAAESTPELSLREPLLALLASFARVAGRPRLLVAPEGNAAPVGQPDIFIKDGARLVGFIETKAPGADLTRLLRQDRQIRRYRQSLPNLVLTDYYRFVFLRDSQVVERVDVNDPEGLEAAFVSFLAYVPPVIRLYATNWGPRPRRRAAG